MRNRVLVVAGVVTLMITGGYSASAADEWTRETVPSLPNVTSVLAAVSSGNGATWAFGGWRAGRDPLVTQSFQRDAAGQWHEVPVPDVGQIEDALVRSATDVWAVSSSGDVPILHWDGSAWTQHSVTPPDLRATMLSVTEIGGQVWAAGTAGGVGAENRPLALRWDGTQWQDSGLPNDVMTYGRAIGGSGPSDVWVTGNGYRPGTTAEIAVALHWDGTQWTEVPLPNPESAYLHDIAAFAPDDVWAVGDRWTDGGRPLVLHWDGTSWSESAVPDLSGELSAVARAGTELRAVGQSYTDNVTLVLRYDGTSWQREKGTPAGLANDVTALADGRPLLVGTVLTGPYQAEHLAASEQP
jgi:hypothetical protein